MYHTFKKQRQIKTKQKTKTYISYIYIYYYIYYCGYSSIITTTQNTSESELLISYIIYIHTCLRQFTRQKKDIQIQTNTNIR